MPTPLSSEIVRSRLRDYSRDGYFYIGSLMKGVALAAATLVLLEIFAGFNVLWPRLLPWVTSLCALLVTYLTWSRGTLLTNSRANLGDAIFPLLLGIDEFCLFAVLSPRLVDASLWRFWFIVLALHAALAFGLVSNRLRAIRFNDDFESDLKGLTVDLRRWIETDRRETALGSAAAFIFGALAVFLLPRWFGGRSYAIVYNLMTCPFLVILAYVTFRSDRQRQAVDEYVSTASATKQVVGPEAR